MTKYVHPKTAHLPPTKEIVRLYDKEKLSARQIANRLNTSQGTVLTRLRESGIEIRTNSDGLKLGHRMGTIKATRYWLGKKMPKDMVERRAKKVRGPNHYLWKGGKEKREYRKAIQKEK